MAEPGCNFFCSINFEFNLIYSYYSFLLFCLHLFSICKPAAKVKRKTIGWIINKHKYSKEKFNDGDEGLNVSGLIPPPPLPTRKGNTQETRATAPKFRK
jgi:hypothetical protein